MRSVNFTITGSRNSATAFRRSSVPSPVMALSHTDSIFPSPFLAICGLTPSARSILLYTLILGTFSAPTSERTFSTSRILLSRRSSWLSITSRRSVASRVSSSVALKASIRSCGRCLMKPTVSETITLPATSRWIMRSVVSSVAKS